MRKSRLLLLALASAACGTVLIAAGSAGPATPGETVKTYIKRLQDNKPYAAVGELFDSREFVNRVFGNDLSSLDPSEQAYVRELVQVFLKTSVGQVPLADALKHCRISEPTITMVNPNEAVARLGVVAPDGKDQSREFRLVRKGSLWMIVDMLPVAQMLHEQWEEAKKDGVTAVEFAEMGAHAMLGERLEQVEARLTKRAPTPARNEAEEAREKKRAAAAAAQEELRRLQQKQKK